MLGFLRRRVLPWLVWLGAAGSAMWLWYDLYVGAARGYVEGISYGVQSPQTARIASLEVLPGQRVQAGQIIAKLDDRELVEELAVLAAERRRMEAELKTSAVETSLRVGDSSRALEESIDSAELARRQARADRSVHAAELAELDTQVKEARDLVDKRMLDRSALVELKIQLAALRKQLEVDDDIIHQLDGLAVAARGRRVELPGVDATDVARKALITALEAIREEEAALTRRKELLELRAPGPGEITALFLRPGELAVEGAVVATIAGPAQTSREGRAIVVVCATEAEAARIEVGEAARLAPPEGGGMVLAAHVQRLAPEVGQLPTRCWRDPRIPQWGRAIYLATDDPVTLLPGQSFAVEFTGERSAHASEAVAEAGEPAAQAEVSSTPIAPSTNVGGARSRPSGLPAAIVVPPELAARTRFEPSALTWWPGRERYVVASDDTGLADVSEHVPWLFLMDASGRVDPEPLVIEGLEKMSDVESLALAPDGGLYVLASQSRSRKGKRSKARQLFAHVALTAAGARATASVELATLLDGLDAAALAELGLSDTGRLDIEGMTATAAGGLLLGLKGPLGSDGAAMVWHLAAPDRLLATGEPSAGGLVAWGRIPLTVTADGKPVPAGIAELLELPDGSLLVAATAAGEAEPKVQDGALFHVRSHESVASGASVAAGAEPVLVRTFPGLKPEGLSRSAEGDSIALVFDAGAGVPQWTEHPWPAH